MKVAGVGILALASVLATAMGSQVRTNKALPAENSFLRADNFVDQRQAGRGSAGRR